MSDFKKSLSDRLHEKSQIAKDVMKRGAQVVVDGAEKGGAAVAQGAQVVADGAQKGSAALAQGAHKGADALAQGAETGGKAIAQGAKIAGEGVQKGAQFVKEHPKETAVVAGAVVVAAGALPFTPFGVPAALGVVAAAAQGAKATQEAMQNCDSDGAAAGIARDTGTSGLLTAVEVGANAAETALNTLSAAKSPKKK